MKRILITGGAGYIGAHTAHLMLGRGYDVTVVDDLSRGRRDPEIETLCARPGVTLIQADLTRPDALAELPKAWDHVYMLAAVVGVRNVERWWDELSMSILEPEWRRRRALEEPLNDGSPARGGIAARILGR